MKFLDSHQALDMFTKMNSLLSDYQQNKEKLIGYEKLQREYQRKELSLMEKMIAQSKETSIYLSQVKTAIDEIMEYFRTLVKQFYPTVRAGITVRNNNGTNQIRYDIEAKIESDASDGINSVKLFCYDLTLLMQGSNHSINFIMHDSRLYSNIDENHSNILFEIVKTKFIDRQYIASINQNQLNYLSDDMQSFIKKNTVLELTDKSDSEKLLGIAVELEYDL